MHDQFIALLNSAIRAPSGDNMQPWRIVVDAAAATIALEVDQTRDQSPMNSGQRMARIAVGAAVEGLLQTARNNGWAVEVEKTSPPTLVLLRLRRATGSAAQMDNAVMDRVTNRCLYDGRFLPAGVLDRLIQECPPLDGVRTHWILDRPRLSALAFLVGRADALMFGEPSMRKAFLSKVRFDSAAAAVVDEGLSLASLELSWSDRLALRTMPHLPDWLLKCGGAMRVFAAKARRLVESASGLCLVVAPDTTDATDLAVGRAMQRAWLALTAEELAAQPMMSWLVLENVMENGEAALVASLGRDNLTSLSKDFRAQLPEIGTERPAFLLRFGFGPPPSGRTGRLLISSVVHELLPEDSSASAFSRRCSSGVPEPLDC